MVDPTGADSAPKPEEEPETKATTSEEQDSMSREARRRDGSFSSDLLQLADGQSAKLAGGQIGTSQAANLAAKPSEEPSDDDRASERARGISTGLKAQEADLACARS